MNSQCWRKQTSWWSVKPMSVWLWLTTYSVSILDIPTPWLALPQPHVDDPSHFDRRDVPATQVGREERRAPPGQVGGVTEHVRLGVGDHAFDLSVLADPQDLARLVAPDVEIAGPVVDGEAVRQHPGQPRDLLSPPRGTVRPDGDPDDRVGERLRDVEGGAVGREREAVREVQRLVEPERSGTVGLEAEDPRSGLGGRIAVGHVQAARPVEDRVVGNPHRVTGDAVGEP